MNTTPEELSDVIYGERSHWENPDNYYHDEYNAAVNRIFITVVAVLSLFVVYQNYGLIGVFIGVLVAIVGGAGAVIGILVVLLAILGFMFEVIPYVFNWLRGR